MSIGQEILPFHIHITSKEMKQLNKLTSKSMETVFLQRLLICMLELDEYYLMLIPSHLSRTEDRRKARRGTQSASLD